MSELLTAAQMRAIEAAAIASGRVTGLELMERAGRGVVEAVFAEWPELQAGSFRAVVLCGPGNNGGDGFVVARLLKEWGVEVEVFLYGTPEGMPPDARVNYGRWVGMGEVRDIFEAEQRHLIAGHNKKTRRWSTPPLETWDEQVILFDALFGIGLRRPIDERLREVILRIEQMASPRVIAIDVPSGLCGDSGRIVDFSTANLAALHEAIAYQPIAADLAVTFHRPKLGHYLADGSKYGNRLRCVDIGLGGTEGAIRLTEMPGKRMAKGTGHKFGYGHALILSGPSGHGGAARMTARGALRIGAGLVTLACPPEALSENAARLDAIMLKTVADGAGLATILSDTRINALCIGPGLGISDETRSLVATALKSARPVVLDADALTLIARDAALFAALHPACVLTPHHGEFARLFPDIAALLDAPATTGPAYSKVDATREAAARAGCTVLYKGPDTVIASPDGTCAINSAAYDRPAPWLATAGSGDVLAGFITGLLTRGFATQQAAETAAWLHVECARSFGPGLIAEDLPEELPKVFRALGL